MVESPAEMEGSTIAIAVLAAVVFVWLVSRTSKTTATHDAATTDDAPIDDDDDGDDGDDGD